MQKIFEDESPQPPRLGSSVEKTLGNDEASDPAGRLIAAAVPVFAQRGFDRATLREIAKRADVNVAAVSYYFGDKMGLYRAVIEDIRDKRQREFPVPDDHDAPPQEMLRLIVRTLLARMLAGDERGFEAMLMMREMQSPTAVLGVLVHEYFKPTYELLRRTIEQLLDPLRPITAAQSTRDGGASACFEALVTQVALGVVGQCLYYRIGRPVLQELIAQETLAAHFDADSLCQHITASTLATCGQFDIIQERGLLDHSPNFESNGRHEH